mgnify:CR=1 FL=1
MLINIFIILICGFLWRAGGSAKFGWAGYRDVLIPLFLGLAIWWITKNPIVGILCSGSFNIIRIGYGAYDPEHDDKPSLLANITKDRDGSLIRFIVGFLYISIGLLPAVIMGFVVGIIPWVLFSFAVAGISYVLNDLEVKDFIIEPSIGACVASSLFLIKGG